MDTNGSTMKRLEDQISWYDNKSKFNQSWFHALKIIEIIFAALIPLFSGFNWPPLLTGLLGVCIVVMEGLQGLFKFHEKWISYRSTCEYLKHEKHFFLASAGP